MNDFDRFLLFTAVDYYLRNKKPDIVAGGVPYRWEMQTLLDSLKSRCASLDD